MTATASHLPSADRSPKSRVLAVLKSRGSSTAQELAAALGVTSPAVRRHLAELHSSGMVELRLGKPAGRGRPQHVYHLSRKGEMSFPQRYAELCTELLENIESIFGSEAVERVLEERNARRRAEWAARLGDGGVEARLQALAELLNEHGYEASTALGEGRCFFLEQANCPSLEVARRYPQVCQAELRLYEALLGARVVRETRIAAGAVSCRYRVEGSKKPA
jgi:predicted ArsR family transcriptional regulator